MALLFHSMRDKIKFAKQVTKWGILRELEKWILPNNLYVGSYENTKEVKPYYHIDNIKEFLWLYNKRPPSLVRAKC